jgi:hypothetical protein
MKSEFVFKRVFKIDNENERKFLNDNFEQILVEMNKAIDIYIKKNFKVKCEVLKP